MAANSIAPLKLGLWRNEPLMSNPITSVDRGGPARSDGEHATTLNASASAATRRLMTHLPRPCWSCRSGRSACCGEPGPAGDQLQLRQGQELHEVLGLLLEPLVLRLEGVDRSTPEFQVCRRARARRSLLSLHRLP